jgi:peptidoglycan-associated lipoprotein
MRNFRTLFIVLIASLAVAACSGRKAVEEDITTESVGGLAGGSTDASADGTGTGDDASGGSDISSSGLAGDSSSDGSGLGADGSGSSLGGADAELLNQRIVYFEFDSSALTPESEAVVEAHSRYLNAASDVNIILEGHADERGTREYNLALGEDRSKSVSSVMEALGVSSGRIQEISDGEERPVALGSDEAAWALNRRVEILYQ